MTKDEYIESCLYGYAENVERLRELRQEAESLCSVRGQGYDVHKGAGIRDPVGEVMMRKERVERRMRRLKSRIVPVRRLDVALREQGANQARGVLHKVYMEHKAVGEVVRELGISRTTQKRRRRELLREARKHFRDIRERPRIARE